ncbi:MAG: hypothetical protein K6T31_04690 [Alicyclobacillus sp.]|nr:hypothetical protein [Alicyclobacillus sp.]
MPWTRVLAHRGWSALYPENTLLAFQKALMAGADGFEFDVQLTADGVPVVIHDETVDRTSFGHGLVRALTLQELRRLPLRGQTGPLPLTIPTLREVLDLAWQYHPHGMYNVEIKAYARDVPALVDKVVEVCLAHPLAPQLLYSSFHPPVWDVLRRRYKTLPLALLFEQIPRRADDLLRRFQPEAVHLAISNLPLEWVKRLQTLHIRVGVWTVDHPDDLRRCYQWGVDWVITNRPDVALHLRTKGFRT